MGPRIPVVITIKKPLVQEYTELTLKIVNDTDPDLISHLKTFAHTPSDIIVNFIKKTLCDEKFIRYWSVHASNKSGSTINRYNGSANEWNLEPKKKVLTNIVDWAVSVLSPEITAVKDFVPNSSCLNEIFCALYNQRTKFKPKPNAD